MRSLVIRKIGIIICIFGFFWNASAEEEEKQESTGSHIRKIDTEGLSPVVILHKEDLLTSGYSSITDVIRKISVSSFGIKRRVSLNSAIDVGIATPSFRGRPKGYVLVLLNGKRLPKTHEGNVDLNIIPISAIERVEIVKDGASSIYGSDALGGVINFITKKGDVGYEFSVGAFVPEPHIRPQFRFIGGETAHVSSTYGWENEGHQGVINIMYRRTQAIWNKSRSFSKMSLGELRDREKNYLGWSSFGSPGSFQFNGKWQAMEGCSSMRKIPSGEMCVFDDSKYSQYSPQVDSFSGFGDLNLNINDGMSVYFRALGSRERNLARLSHAGDFLNVTPKMVEAWGVPADRIHYRLVFERGSGRRESLTLKNTLNVQAGSELYLRNKWHLEANLDFSGYYFTQNNFNFFKKDELIRLAESGVWNPFNKIGEKGSVLTASYNPRAQGYYLSGVADIQLDGEIFSLGSLGAVYSVFGFRPGYEYVRVSMDEEKRTLKTGSFNQWGGSAYWGKGKRDFQTLYGEFYLLMDYLEFQTAGSIDRYQGFGMTAHPTVSLSVSPFSFFKMRGSWNTGFQAPSLISLSSYRMTRLSGFDQVWCRSHQSLCEPVTVETTFIGNKNLRPFTSRSYNVGSILQFSDFITFSTDYFSSEIKNAVIQDSMILPLATSLEAQGRGDLLKKNNIKIKRSSVLQEGSVGALESLTVQLFNGPAFRSQGLEFDLTINVPVSAYTAYLKAETAYLLDVKVRLLDEGGFQYVDRLGHWGIPKTRFRSALGIKNTRGLVLEGAVYGVSGYYQQTSFNFTTSECVFKGVECAKVPWSFTFDAVLVLPLVYFGNLKGNILFKVENILDSEPPLNDRGSYIQSNLEGSVSAGYVPIGLHSINGRTWKLQYTHKF